MIGFVSSIPVAARASSFAGRAACVAAVRPTAAKWTMAKSTATPFLEAQPNLAGWAGDEASFDPLGLSSKFPTPQSATADVAAHLSLSCP